MLKYPKETNTRILEKYNRNQESADDRCVLVVLSVEMFYYDAMSTIGNVKDNEYMLYREESILVWAFSFDYVNLSMKMQITTLEELNSVRMTMWPSENDEKHDWHVRLLSHVCLTCCSGRNVDV
jgi:hypothetical protein